MKACVVIGANFGDEGKGLVTDWLVSKEPETSLVVRYNGGAQAGHTVEHEGKRHIFSHFGSGSFLNVPTFFSKDFILNPIKFFEEREVLRTLGMDPIAYVDPRSKITTPWDMIYNQTTEARRGDSAHGSCGLGIHATVVRDLKIPLSYQIAESLMYKDGVYKSYLRNITEFYYKLTKDEIFKDEVIFNKFSDDLKQFINDSKCICALPYSLPTTFTNIVFEGAQGLMLDRSYVKYFPHLTDSNTGLKNISEYCDEFDIKKVDVYYVTRTYVTRHGNGPFETEDPELSYEELTNVTNKYQGQFRFGYLNVDTLIENIKEDLQHLDGIVVNSNLVVTHCDQNHPKQRFVIDGNTIFGIYSDVQKQIEQKLYSEDIHGMYSSYGPSRETIV